MYSSAINRLESKSGKSLFIEETPYKECPAPFYNWLNERYNSTQICSKPNLVIAMNYRGKEKEVESFSSS